MTSTSHDILTLRWKDIPLLESHGVMRNFSISCAGILANKTLHERNEIVLYDDSVAPNEYSFEMIDLFPHTEYNCSIMGCTRPGCGDPTPQQLLITQDYCKYCLYYLPILFYCLFVCLFVYLFVCFLFCLFVCLFVNLLICLFVCLLICLFVCLFVFFCLFVCLFVCLFQAGRLYLL